jgi:hypothetical protein
LPLGAVFDKSKNKKLKTPGFVFVFVVCIGTASHGKVGGLQITVPPFTAKCTERLTSNWNPVKNITGIQ